MIRSILTRLVAGYVAIALVLVTAWVVTMAATNTVRQDYSRTVQTVDALADHVLLRAKLTDDEETGLRGYLLTGAREFLQPYEAARLALPRVRRASDQLAAHDPEVLPLVLALHRRGQAWEARSE